MEPPTHIIINADDLLYIRQAMRAALTSLTEARAYGQKSEHTACLISEAHGHLDAADSVMDAVERSGGAWMYEREAQKK